MSFRRETAVNSTTWIVAADRSQARIFESRWPDLQDVRLLEECGQPEGRMQAKEIDAGAFGRGRSPDGRGSPYDAETDHRHDSAARMAGALVDRMESGRARNAFGHIIVVAPPLVLGELRRQFRPRPELSRLLEAEVDKELVHLEASEILRHAQIAAAAS